MALMYKLHKMQRTLKDGRTDTSNGKWFGRVWGIFTRMSEFFRTDNRGVSRNRYNPEKIEKCRWIEKQEKKSVMLSDNPCENSKL